MKIKDKQFHHSVEFKDSELELRLSFIDDNQLQTIVKSHAGISF